MEKYEWLCRCTKLTSTLNIEKKLLCVASNVLVMNPLNATLSSLKTTLFVRAMLPHRPSVFNNALLLISTFPIYVTMDSMAFYEMYLLSDFVSNYFENVKINNESAKYIVCLDFFLPILWLYSNYYHTVSVAHRSQLERHKKESKHISREINDNGDEKVQKVCRQNREETDQRHDSNSIVAERSVSVSLLQLWTKTLQVLVGIQKSTVQKNLFEPTCGQ